MVSLANMFFIRSQTGSDQGPRFRPGSLRENILDNNSNKTPEKCHIPREDCFVHTRTVVVRNNSRAKDSILVGLHVR